MKTIKKAWEYDVIGILNYRKYQGSLRFYFDFVRQNFDKLDGDIVEAGVFQGKSLISMGLMLKSLGSSKKVFGFDSFSGFPPVFNEKDAFVSFELLFNQGKISSDHYADVVKNKELKQQLSGEIPTPNNISSSGNFSLTSKDLVEKKIKLLDLDNIILIDGSFEDTMHSGNGPAKIMAALMDCDLYSSYKQTFSYVWPKLVSGGLIYLDEYYSLKFPGARIASDEFLSESSDSILTSFSVDDDEFPRFGMLKK